MIPLRIEARASGGLDQVVERLRHPFRAVHREAAEILRDSVDEEFAGGFWKAPDGRRVPWAPTRAFGTRPAGPPLGGAAGRFARAWRGGAGSTERHTDQSIAVGVDLPFAAVHRGGAGQSAARTETRVRAQKRGARGLPAMFWYLGMRYGVWISPRRLLTVGIRIPARRHATDNPDVRRRLADLLARHLVSGNPRAGDT